jgi:endonuclease YncB( thermonuclease family)
VPPVHERAAASPLPGRRGLLAALTCLLGAACGRLAPSPARIGPRIESVADGDSFTVLLPDGARAGVRIAGIDAPEKDQPWADASRAHLSDLLSRGELHLALLKTDPYGRQVARVRAGGEDVGLAQVRAGLAWHFVRYAADQDPDERGRYAQAEREARAARRGLWADPAPQPPWAHRQRQRSG